MRKRRLQFERKGIRLKDGAFTFLSPQLRVLPNGIAEPVLEPHCPQVPAFTAQRLRRNEPPIQAAQEDGPRGRLPQRAIRINPLVLRCVLESKPPYFKQTDYIPSPTESVTIRGIGRLLENHYAETFLELTRFLLSTAATLPTLEARPPNLLKTVIMYINQWDQVAQNKQSKSLVARLKESWWLS
jgi:hypothetical protein